MPSVDKHSDEIRAGLTDKVIFELRPEGIEGVNHVAI